jgi:outer membrane murein-binding lipoprotein Lpp
MVAEIERLGTKVTLVESDLTAAVTSADRAHRALADGDEGRETLASTVTDLQREVRETRAAVDSERSEYVW